MKNYKLPPFRKNKFKNHLEQSKLAQIIYQADESEILRKPSVEVDIKKIKTKIIQDKINYLKKCLLKYRKITGLGRGIAAPQVGIAEKIAVVYTTKELITIINPKIIVHSFEKYRFKEMCMSAVPVAVNLVRPSWIEFEYFDEIGKFQTWKTKDKTKLGKLLNRVFQHEIDHLEGKLNIDLASSIKDLIFVSNPNFFKTLKFEKVG